MAHFGGWLPASRSDGCLCLAYTDSRAGFSGFFGPKVVFGCQENVQKFCEIPTVGLDLYRGTVLTTPPNRAMDSPMVQQASIQW